MSGAALTMWISWKSVQNCDFLYIYEFIRILTLPYEKRDHPNPPSPPSEVEDIRIVVISFRNIAKTTKKNSNIFLTFIFVAKKRELLGVKSNL